MGSQLWDVFRTSNHGLNGIATMRWMETYLEPYSNMPRHLPLFGNTKLTTKCHLKSIFIEQLTVNLDYNHCHMGREICATKFNNPTRVVNSCPSLPMFEVVPL